MKSIIKKVFYSILLVSLSLLASCQKDMQKMDDLDLKNFAGLACFNGLSINNSLNMKIDEKFFSSEIEDFPSGSYIPYRTIFPGDRTISLQAKYASSYLFKGPMKFEANKLYSIFFYGSNKAEYLLSQDELNLPNNNECKIRVVNLIQDKGVKFAIRNSSKTENQPLGIEVSEFKTQQLEPLHFTTTLIDKELPELNFTLNPINKGIYTICLYVQINPVDQQKIYKYALIKY